MNTYMLETENKRTHILSENLKGGSENKINK